jgi:hypothetical protein
VEFGSMAFIIQGEPPAVPPLADEEQLGPAGSAPEE